jgi:predicted secreted protein
MAFGAGTASVFKITQGGSAQFGFDLSPYITSVDADWPVDEIDVTTLGQNYKQFLAGFQDATFTIEGIWDPTADAVMFNLRGGTAGPWRYYPQGTASTKVYYQGTAVVTNYSPPTDVNEAVTFTLELHNSGALTRNTV